LRSHLAVLDQHRAYINRYIGDGLNLFDFIGYDENNLSDVIAKLLDPEGRHGQGRVFLSKFLNLAATSSTQEGPLNPFFQIEQAVLRQERVRIGREHGTAGGRLIDVVGDIGAFRFAIENKPRAGDLDKQVTAYLEHLKYSRGNDWAFIYLSGYGASPSNDSLSRELRQDVLKSGHYVEWDYAGELNRWVQQCALACEADKIRWFLRDFGTYIQREFASTRNEEVENA
jgi:hypothetical protein